MKTSIKIFQVSKTLTLIVLLIEWVDVQLDVEVVFEYPNISAVGVVEEGNFNDNFDCSQGGSAHHGVLGPFGLLVLTDNDFQEQTALFFYLAHTNDGQWTTRFRSDQSR